MAIQNVRNYYIWHFLKTTICPIRLLVTQPTNIIYKNMILPIFDYGKVLLVSANATLRKKLQILQNKALKCALGLDPATSSEEVHKLARIDKLKVRRELQLTQIMFKVMHP